LLYLRIAVPSLPVIFAVVEEISATLPAFLDEKP
jgi:hypothetical protein